jgi:hypothetical protein
VAGRPLLTGSRGWLRVTIVVHLRKVMRKNKGEITLDHEMKDAAFRAAFEKESAALEVSESLAKQMARVHNAEGSDARSGLPDRV